MDLIAVAAAVQGGTQILGMFHGKDFVWPDPWTDIWDEGTTVLWENVWHDRWTAAYSDLEPVSEKVKELLHGRQ